MNSLQAFEENIKATDLFTARIHAMSTYLKPAKPEAYPKTISPDALKFAMFDEAHFEKIFEMGFIGLFANFEHFMYEFIRELYTKQPKAIPSDKTIKAEDILQFKNYKSVTEFLIDTVAIENSYDIETWNNTIQKLFNIKPIADDTKVRLLIMNSMRNMFLHSGGHWNSKIYKDSKKIEKAMGKQNASSNKIQKETKFRTAKSSLSPQLAYSTTISCFQDIIKDIKSQMNKKSSRKKKASKHNA